ncbi:oxidoreductase, short chain dehydrogenase/reductase family protein [Aeromicrobium marinum DSM 15272]|uniref:Oxidoreductase, short chain dehydrogenase/reductase family protein n=1 Tax=Aeromicrobium marinum DSM 15272 TaxID=585531 RepID=E2SDA2_9ACTN|nr:SDR family oxidoreductase [Aeromicrobium marinum]EFQ82479.1 oxidoreductase, short chain dehydrogenase/reductase family protein [Aeromicrobium marinum DSM 15272]
MGTLEGKVAVVTGAGRGIGREHALLLAAEGAAVVVNDLGGDSTGDGADATPAQETVALIEAAGGRAVVNGGNVADWADADALVEQAVDTFGGLDVLVNNAGILRDAYIAATTEAEWDAVIAVHLKGHFGPLRHAAAWWKSQAKAGSPVAASVINTASASGTFMPNAGQANYGSAKAGIAALTLVAADELARFGGRANCIAPIARTRLTLQTPGFGAMFAEEVPEGELDTLGPQNISPLVAYLASDACTLTGKVFAVQGGNITELQGWTGARSADTTDAWSIGSVAAAVSDWT